jgi:septal ring factor EnvC (AmiA/AmiB activator)
MKEKNEWYADTIKEKDTASDKVNSDMAELAQERDDLDNKCSRLKAELKAVT